MADTKWLEIAVNTTPDKLDEVCAKLAAAGMDGLVIEDEGEFLQFLEQNRQYWDYVDQELLDRMRGITRVKFYVTDDDEGHKQLERYTHGLGFEHTVTPLSDNDWAYSWQKYYKPLSIGQRLYVVPEWERDKPVPEGRSPLYLNPGLTFGTGSHDTTQLCMMALEDAVKPGDKLLDMGTGSGILAIAAAMLGADVQTIVDIDENCLKTAHENAEKNHVEIGRGLCGDALRDPKLVEDIGGGYDVIVANIVADVIIGMSPMFADKLVKGGTLICSGILNERAEEVRAALEKSGFTILSHAKSDDWSAFAAKK